MTRDDMEFDVADTSDREAKHQSGGRAYLNMPSGLSMFQSKKKTQPFNIDVVAFQVTDEIAKFAPNLRFAQPGKWYGEQTFWMHRQVGANSESYVCLAKACGKPCPVCEDIGPLRNANDPAGKARFKEMKPKERQLFLVVDHDDPRPQIYLWDEAYFNFGERLDQYCKAAPPVEREKFKQYYHPLNGMTIRLIPKKNAIGDAGDAKGGKGGENTVYDIYGIYPRQSPLPRDLFRHGYDLSAIVRVLDYATLRDIYKCGAEVSDAPRDAERTSVSAPRDDGWSRPTNGWNTDGATTVRWQSEQPNQSAMPRQTSDAPPRRQPEPEPEPQPARRPDRQGWDTTAPAPQAAPRPAAKLAPAGPAGDDPEFAVGDEVATYYRKEWHTGPVVEVIASRRAYLVDVGWDEPLPVAFEDAKAANGDAPAPRRQPDPEPEPEPAPPPRRRAPAPPAEEPPPPKPAARRATPPADPQDDAPPARPSQPRRPAVPQDDDLDDPPAPRRRQ